MAAMKHPAVDSLERVAAAIAESLRVAWNCGLASTAYPITIEANRLAALTRPVGGSEPVELLRDLAENGLRFSLTPCLNWTSKESIHAFWSDYMRRADQSIRDRAESALASPQGAEQRQDKGPWHVSKDGRDVFSDDFDVDAALRLSGDFRNDAHRRAYADWLCGVLNVTPHPAQTASQGDAVELPPERRAHPAAYEARADAPEWQVARARVEGWNACRAEVARRLAALASPTGVQAAQDSGIQMTLGEARDLASVAETLCDDDVEYEVRVQYLPAGAVLDDDNAPEPAGLFMCDAEYPEEGWIPIRAAALAQPGSAAPAGEDVK